MLSRFALIGLLVTGCVPPTPVAEQTMPEPMPEPVQVAGPPGGGMDQPGDPASYGDPPSDDAEATQDVSDAEIDATLEGYGQWEDDPDAGQVWRPDATLVGADFTPYDSGGSWVYTDDYGWTFNCDYGWGWLPFHYGRWGWFRDHWGWVRGHEWGPAWVDWRHGGGYVGWRPMAPVIRDHRMEVPESHWHFVGEHDMGNGHIRGKEVALGEGMRATVAVDRPSYKGAVVVRASSVMTSRPRPGATVRAPRAYGGVNRQPTAIRPPAYRPYTQQPYQPARPAYRQPTYTQPNYSRPPTYTRPTYNPQSQQRPTYQPRPTYTQPARPTYSPPPARPTYSPPPARPTYSPPPARPSYSPPPATHASPPASSPPASSSGGHHR